MQLSIIISGIICSYISAYLAAHLLKNQAIYQNLETRSQRFNVLDGLRGYLATGVFIHHGIMYWAFLSSGEYVRPEHNLSENLGKVSVAIFFIITGFLFTSKLLNIKGNINWFSIYNSRVFRLFPLYLFVLAVISFIVYIQTGGSLQVSPQELVKDYIKWALFHGAAINGYQDTGMIISGVDWSLKYEWLFYLSLPLLLVTIKLNSLILFAFIGLLSILGSLYPDYYFTFNSRYLILFFSGGLIAKYCHINTTRLRVNKLLGQALFTILLLVALLHYDTFSLWHSLIISLLFFVVISGITRFDLFHHKASLILGEISYSIYLIHGIVLYLLFFTNSNLHFLASWPVLFFLVVMPIISCLVVLISHGTFYLIEFPGMQLGKMLGTKPGFSNLLSLSSSTSLQDANRKIKIPFSD